MRQILCDVEAHGTDPTSVLMQGNVMNKREELLARFAGTIQTIYLDPPFNTGKMFFHKQRVGETGWRSGNPVLQLAAYSDQWKDDAFMNLLREAAEISHSLLKEDGSLFFHIDSRMHASVKLMLDEIFGRQHFVNEIIWAYESGGRATTHFSRKHDVILYYRKTKNVYFDIEAVSLKRSEARNNHMRKGTDENGQAYRSITTNGKEYRYYDDDVVYPGDVWNDISHLQQRDPQRSGFDNQKPMKLLERILLCSTRKGDIACDLFAGSGTTGVVAGSLGRRFLLMDASPLAIAISRSRLIGLPMRIEAPMSEGAPEVEARYSLNLGTASVELLSYRIEDGLCGLALEGLDAVNQISAGFMREDVFYALDNAARSGITPQLSGGREIPLLNGHPALLTVDVLGRRFVHEVEEDAYARED